MPNSDYILNTATTIFTQPSLYTIVGAILLAFYLVWALARQQYLGTVQQFDVLAISLAGFALGLFIVRSLYPGYLLWPDSWQLLFDAWRAPFTITGLVGGYALAGLIGWRYIKKIRYPYWRVMDMNVLGLALIGWGYLIGQLITVPNITNAILVGAWALLLVGQFVLYYTTSRPGITSGAHLAATFGFCLGAMYMLAPWQGSNAGVEYSLAITMIVVGLAVIALRWRRTSLQPAITQLPAGVSQRFRDTFMRGLLQQPSAKGGSSHSKSKRGEK